MKIVEENASFSIFFIKKKAYSESKMAAARFENVDACAAFVPPLFHIHVQKVDSGIWERE